MKKEFVFLLLWLWGADSMEAQQVSLLSNKFRTDYVLERQEMSASQFCIQDNEGVWSLENVESLGEPFPVSFALKDDSLMQIERGGRTLFHQQQNGLEIIGVEDNQTIITYDMPEKWLHHPIALGDSVCGFFNGTGKYCDRIFLRRFGTYWTKADAEGKLVLPTGDTLKNVIRLHTERYVSTITAPIDTIAYKIPSFNTDSIINNMAKDTCQIKESIYRWYTDNNHCPVLEVKITQQQERIFKREVFYFAHDFQNQIIQDDMADKSMQSIYKDLTSLNSEDKKPGILYHITKEKGNARVTIRYDLYQPMKIKLILADLRGYVFQQLEDDNAAGSGYSMSLNTSGLRKGQYIIYIIAGNKKYIEKFNI